MREILFRGKTKDNEWLYGYYMYNSKHLIVDTTKGSLGFGKEVIPETVGQYVGIKDKNGKKVYVGDIIKARHNFYPYTVFVRECKVWIEDKYGNAIRPTTEALKHFDCEVIGNIFDKGNENE